MDDVESDSQQIKTEQLTDPESQDDFQLAALRLVEQNRIAVQNNTTLLSNEHYEELDSVTEAWWTTADHIIPASLIEEVDENVISLMPEGTEIISIAPFGTSNWSRTAEVQTELDGEERSYFLKVNDYRSGPIMFRSEFESLKAIYKAVPGFCPNPLGWGQYASDPDVHFLLTPFVDMYDEAPDPDTLPPRMAELHRNGVSPDMKFGFHVPVAGGPLPLRLARSSSWEDYLTRYLRYFFRAEEIAQGERPSEMQDLIGVLFDRIMPRLIRPLETGGREITPRILHTDLWSGNRAVDENGEPIIFDPCSIYGHNEFDLGIWSFAREPYGQAFLHSYHTHFSRSAPEEDSEGRNALYALAFEVRVSATLTGHDQLFRKEYMSGLNEKYPESYEDWATSRGETVCPPKVEYRKISP
ncbi:hypothetical protein LA080_002291 [Diaporthe eres]|nr:hypothetical protein LA080_002291 [Diaporthe eres]